MGREARPIREYAVQMGDFPVFDAVVEIASCTVDNLKAIVRWGNIGQLSI
jgi:hypothetical protein